MSKHDHSSVPAGTLPTLGAESQAPPRRRDRRLLLSAYGTWLTAALALQIAGYADTRATRDLFTILAELAVAAIVIIVWLFRTPLAGVLEGLGIRGPARFILVGLLPAYISEVLFYYATSPEMPLGVFLLRTLVWYVGWLGAWWWLRRRYALSTTQMFFLGGFNGFIVEGLILRPVPLSPLGLFLYPLVASLYGATLLVPHAVSQPVDGPGQGTSPARMFALSLLPLLAFVPGLVWMALVQSAFGVR